MLDSKVPQKKFICPICNLRVKTRPAWVEIINERYHLSCARKKGLVKETRGRKAGTVTTGRSKQSGGGRVTIWLSAMELAQLETFVTTRKTTQSEFLRSLLEEAWNRRLKVLASTCL